MKKPLNFFVLCLACILSACMGSTGQETETDDIFMDYKIWGEEGNDSVMVMIQFREFGPTGPTVRIQPGTVSLDGQMIPADSSEMTGPFYTVSRSIRDFTGKHKIVFIGADKKKFEEEFSFKPFNLKTQPGDTITRDRTIIELEGLDKKDFIRVLLSDTTYPGEGLDRVDTVWNNRLILTKGTLSYLEPGPIFLELIREQEKPLRQRTATGGTLSMSYTIRREFWLQE